MSSCLDYCNSLLYVIIDSDLMKLQHIQNRFSRLVTKSPLCTRSLPPLHSLHCLQIRFRILLRITLFWFCNPSLKKQPVYLHSMLAASLPPHSLRSNKIYQSVDSWVKTNTGARAFHSCVLSLWNNLPLSVHSAISVATFRNI